MRRRSPAGIELAMLLTLFGAPAAFAAEPESSTAIEIVTAAPNAQVFIDGTPEGPKTNVPIAVEPGSHEVTVQAEGHAIYKQWVVAEDGRTLSLQVDLLPLGRGPSPTGDTSTNSVPEPAITGVAPPKDSAEETPWFERWWVWGAVGTVVMGGVLFAVLASSGDDFVPGGELGRTSTRDWMSP